MNKKFNLLKNAKYIIVLLFLVFSAISVVLFGTIKINYNISDYLDESTDTKISLGIMEEEFGLVSNVQVMIENISADEANEVKNKLKSIENVNFVNFNSTNENYYKDNTALFVILVNGNEYSDTAKAALADIVEAMDSEYGDRVNYGGAVMEKKLLREAIVSEIFLILGISVALCAVLMLLTAESWIEPIVLLAASGVAVLINMGTNAIFGEISYITNAVAAILQLALSIDYSIVLLHSYRSIKESGLKEDNEHAMLAAIKEVISPVSASALTTMAGLLALLFMSFTIGRDIGMVLMKSIVISAITSLTLLPAFLLIFDKLLSKTSKKAFVIKGKAISGFAVKAGKFLVPVACVLIVVCCILNMNNKFSFVDTGNSNKNINDKFGNSGTLIVLYENTDDAEEKEKLLSELLSSYQTESGKKVLKSYVAYTNTIGQIYDVEKASRDLGIDKKDAELLFTIYHFTRDESAIKLSTREFAEFATDLLKNDPDASGFVSEETAGVLDLLLTLDALLDGNYSSNEFYNEISSLEIMQGKDLSKFAIDQMYGLYFFDSEINSGMQKHVNFKTMLSFMIESEMLDAELVSQLTELYEGTKDLVSPQKQMAFNDFKELVKSTGAGIPDWQLIIVWQNQLKLKITDTISYIDLMRFLVANNYVTEQTLVNAISNYEELYRLVNANYSYERFMPTLIRVTEMLTGSAPDVETPDSAIQQLYIMYFYENKTLNTGRIGGRDFIEYIIDTVETNETVAGQLPDGILSMLEDLIALDDFLNDSTKYDYREMTDTISSFASKIKSMDVSVSLSEAAMMGLYVKYSTANNLIETGSISATDLLAFVLDASENNELLSSRIDEDMRATIRESQENILIAEKLLIADKHSRMLLTIDLPAESAESSQFINDLSKAVKEIFGDKAYVAGEMATTNDLIIAFDADNRLISIFTVVSIFIIVMVVFKSLSLPVILVAIIQGAVWIAMAMSFGGNPMFFMSYIMAMCILMGATIDYGILLSTSYVRARQNLDRKDALEEALNTALPTVFTSGIILMICGLVVGLVASQTSISSVGFLLCRGTLVSCIMIVFVLPSILYLLDKIVVKLTIQKSLVEIVRSIGKK